MKKSEDQLDQIRKASSIKPVFIFIHSRQSSMSRVALDRMEGKLESGRNEPLETLLAGLDFLSGLPANLRCRLNLRKFTEPAFQHIVRKAAHWAKLLSDRLNLYFYYQNE